MIIFDLQCADARHVFEAWFGSSADFESQRKKALVSCPLCGSDKVEKAIMAPVVAAKSNQKTDFPIKGDSNSMAVSNADIAPAERKAMLEMLAKQQAKALENSDYVGEDFSDEARAMHDGDIDKRPIHGQTSLDDAKALLEDGVPIAPLPLPIRPPKSDN